MLPNDCLISVCVCVCVPIQKCGFNQVFDDWPSCESLEMQVSTFFNSPKERERCIMFLHCNALLLVCMYVCNTLVVGISQKWCCNYIMSAT